jgi:hypothetical protein
MSTHSCDTSCSGQLSATHASVGAQCSCEAQPWYAPMHGPTIAHCQQVSQSVGAVQSSAGPLDDSPSLLTAPLEPVSADPPDPPEPSAVEPSLAADAVLSEPDALVSLAPIVVEQLPPMVHAVVTEVSSFDDSFAHPQSATSRASRRSIAAS